MIEACGRIEKEGLKRSRLFVDFAWRFEGYFLRIYLPFAFAFLLSSSPHINSMLPTTRFISIYFHDSCLPFDITARCEPTSPQVSRLSISPKIHN